MFTSNPERLPAQTPTGAYACWRSRLQAYRGSSWLAPDCRCCAGSRRFSFCWCSLRSWSSRRCGPLRRHSGDIHMRAPVRMFFVLDPLVAITNAIATHALYRGLLWSLVILLPTLFLGRFFCGWICPMGTLQHFVGNSHSEAKRGKQRIESNRYKRWQTIKYVVLIAGLVAAFFGSMVIGTLDPFSLLVRSIGLALLPAFNFAVRAVLVPHGAQPRSRDQNQRRMAALDPAGHSPRFSTGALRAEPGAGLVVPRHPWASLRVTRFWCRAICPLGALLGAVSRWSILGLHKDASSLRQLQSLPAALPGRRRSHRRCAMAKVRVPDVHELRGQLPAWEPAVSASFRKEREVASPDLGRRRTLTGLAAGAAVVPLMRANTGLRQKPARASCCGHRARWTKPIFFRAAFAAASA